MGKECGVGGGLFQHMNWRNEVGMSLGKGLLTL